MKKKDLKLGVVYADKRGRAYLLINTQIWHYNHYDKSWRTSRFTTPAARQGFSFSGRGVLVLNGSAEGLRQWALEHPELLDYDGSLNREADDREFIERLREALPAGSNFHIQQEDYRQWPGLYDEVNAKLDIERQLKEAEQDRLRAEVAAFNRRATTVAKGLTDRGLDLWGKATTSWLQGEHDQSAMYHSGYTLTLDDLEHLLGIKAEES